MKPPFIYFGAKQRVAARIVALLPPHVHYIEPFAGSLSVLLAKPRSRMETVNDLDGELVAFWRTLRDRPEELERACFLTPHSRAERVGAMEPADDDLEAARRVWVRLTQGRGGHVERRTGWRCFVDPHGTHSSMPDYLAAYVSRLAPAALRLLRVSLECRPAAEVIADYGQHADNLLYCDPPYLGSARAWRKDNGYSHEMLTEDEHRELAGSLHAARAAVVLSGYDSPLYADLYAGWHRAEITALAGNAVRDRDRTEILWSNRPFPQGSLFDLEALPAAVPCPACPAGDSP